jgi:H+/gluconate symporter-like permease
VNAADVPHTSKESTTGESVQIANILIAHDRLAQRDQALTITSVNRNDFVSGEITFQRACKQPLILSLIAIAMIWIGLQTAWGIVEWLTTGGTVGVSSVMMVLLLPGGGAFLYQAWRQAPLLIIQTGSGTRRMEFKGDRSKGCIIALESAARKHGYPLRLGAGPWH